LRPRPTHLPRHRHVLRARPPLHVRDRLRQLPPDHHELIAERRPRQEEQAPEQRQQHKQHQHRSNRARHAERLETVDEDRQEQRHQRREERDEEQVPPQPEQVRERPEADHHQRRLRDEGDRQSPAGTSVPARHLPQRSPPALYQASRQQEARPVPPPPAEMTMAPSRKVAYRSPDRRETRGGEKPKISRNTPPPHGV